MAGWPAQVAAGLDSSLLGDTQRPERQTAIIRLSHEV